MSASCGWSLLSSPEKRALAEAIASDRATPGPRFLDLQIVGPSGRALDLGVLTGQLPQLAARGLRAMRLGGVGEPLGHPQLSALLGELGRLGVAVDELVTNGVGLTPELRSLLAAAKCRQVTFLLTSARPSDFRRLTALTDEDFVRARTAARDLLRNRAGESDPAVVARFFFDRYNFRDLLDMYWQGRDMGCDRIEVEPLRAGSLRGATERHLMVEGDGDLLHPFIDVLSRDRQFCRLRMRLPFRSWRVMLEEWASRLTEAGEGPEEPAPAAAVLGNDQCFFGWYGMTVDGNGGLFPCRKLAADPATSPLGDIAREGLVDAWSGAGFTRFRREQREVLLQRGRTFHRSRRYRTLARRCVEPGACGLKTRCFETDRAFYRHLAEALEEPRSLEVRWRGRPTQVLRAAEVLLFRGYHGLCTRARKWGQAMKRDDAPRAATTRRGARLHLGCGRKRLCGWVNVDRLPFRGVDVVADVTQGLCFTRAEAVFAEHFLEHLEIDQALRFLAEVHTVLRPDGWLRLSTPNLDWVWQNHYRFEDDAGQRRQMAMSLNRSFYGWGHRFLWNRELLAEVLECCGFTEVRWCRYRETAVRLFHGIEQHEPEVEDSAALPHVLVAEARKGPARPARLEELSSLLQREFLRHVRGSEEAERRFRRPSEPESQQGG